MKKVVENSESFFDGEALIIFKYKVLVLICNILTLGLVVTPFCRLIEYKVNHTVLNGKRLKFYGNTKELFYLRLEWLFYTIFTFGIFLIFIPMNTLKWIVDNTGYEDQHELIVGDSFFRGKIISYSGLYFLCNFLNIISLGLMYPFCVTLLMKEITRKTYINGFKIIYKGDSLSLLLKYLKWFFMTIITFGIYGIWAECYNTKYIVSNIMLKKEGDMFESESNVVFISSMLVLGLFMFLIVLKLFLDKFF